MFSLVTQQFVSWPDVEFILFGLVDVVDDERHAHVCIKVNEFFAHFGLHLGDHVVQFAARKAILQFQLVSQVGFSQ
jgi:hypothetical protein